MHSSVIDATCSEVVQNRYSMHNRVIDTTCSEVVQNRYSMHSSVIVIVAYRYSH